jgi:hypothetical protein
LKIIYIMTSPWFLDRAVPNGRLWLQPQGTGCLVSYIRYLTPRAVLAAFPWGLETVTCG